MNMRDPCLHLSLRERDGNVCPDGYFNLTIEMRLNPCVIMFVLVNNFRDFT